MERNRSGDREIDLSRAWAEHRLPGDLRLIDGRRVQIIYHGVWSNSDGPDFMNAMLSVGGRLERGAVELHLRASDWYRHGHDVDPAYDEVILHVVGQHDLSEPVRTSSGTLLPTLEIGDMRTDDHAYSDSREQRILASLGKRTCLPTLGRSDPERVRAALRERGWSRLVEKQLRFSQDLQVLTAPEVLYRGVLDALGYSANREPMAMLGQRVPLQVLHQFADRREPSSVLAALLGAAGFLPLSPSMEELIGSTISIVALEREWPRLRDAYGIDPLPMDVWTLNRVRPANHPVARLASLGSLIVRVDEESFFEQLLALPLDGGRSWDRWLASANPPIGESRRRQIIVNIFAPLFAAYADMTRDDGLAEQVAADWERLPGGVSDRIARATRRQIVGDMRFPIRLALEEQGLHEIHRNGCSELRCFECPIARLAVEHEPWDEATGRP